MFSFAGFGSWRVKKTGPFPLGARHRALTPLLHQVPGVPGNHQVFIGLHDAPRLPRCLRAK